MICVWDWLVIEVEVAVVKREGRSLDVDKDGSVVGGLREEEAGCVLEGVVSACSLPDSGTGCSSRPTEVSLLGVMV